MASAYQVGEAVKTTGQLAQVGQPVVPAGTTGKVVQVHRLPFGVRVYEVAWATGVTTTVANAHLLLQPVGGR